MKSNTIKTVVIVFGMILFISNNSFGQSEKKERGKKPPTFSKLLEKMDTNEDGKLSKEEVKGPLKDHFTKIDIDENGFITKEEFDKAPKPKRKGATKRN